MAYIPLCQLKEGQYGIIRSITCPKEQASQKQAILQRFLDLGFCEETPVQCINIGMFRNPHAYKIRGSVMAIRSEDAAFIFVEPLAESCKIS